MFVFASGGGEFLLPNPAYQFVLAGRHQDGVVDMGKHGLKLQPGVELLDPEEVL